MHQLTQQTVPLSFFYIQNKGKASINKGLYQPSIKLDTIGRQLSARRGMTLLQRFYLSPLSFPPTALKLKYSLFAVLYLTSTIQLPLLPLSPKSPGVPVPP